MPSRLPSLNALRAFAAAARHVSFRLAADELCVTPGAVSRQIRALETHLGVALFDRSRRQVQLTPAGARYFTRIAALFAQMEEATEDARGQEPPDGVRLDVIPTFAMHWLLPRLPDFRRRHPGIEVVLTTATGPVDRGARVDYAVRRDVAHFAGLAPVPLMEEVSTPIGRPGMGPAGRTAGAGGPGAHRPVFPAGRPRHPHGPGAGLPRVAGGAGGLGRVSVDRKHALSLPLPQTPAPHPRRGFRGTIAALPVGGGWWDIATESL